MPELPEVETIVRGLRPRLVGQSIERVIVRQAVSHGVVKGSVAQFRRSLKGAVITKARRRAKYLLFDLNQTGVAGLKATWLVHLGMTGQLYACKPEAVLLKHTHLTLWLSSGEQVRFCDPRRFGKTLVLPSMDVAGYLSHIGPDPLEIAAGEFLGILEGRKAPVKNLLLNQLVLGGVGNIYANEALYLARIHPACPAGRLTSVKGKALYRTLRKVLKEAIRNNGTTVADYRTSEGEPGWYQNRLRVYDREGEPCPRCRKPIRRLVLGQRSAHYCPSCQPRGRKPRKKISRKRAVAS